MRHFGTADLPVAVPCIAGLVGANLYHAVEDPRLLMDRRKRRMAR
ncbi:MAG: hypothetical protein WA020_09125 [Candidatus Acidiferrales bacterium]